jgi:hypothetical protein
MFRHNALPPSSGFRIYQSNNKKTSMNPASHFAWYMRLDGCLFDLLSILKMEAVPSTETSANFYHTTLHQILEGVTLSSDSHQNPEPKIIISAQFSFRCSLWFFLSISLYFSWSFSLSSHLVRLYRLLCSSIAEDRPGCRVRILVGQSSAEACATTKPGIRTLNW